MAGLNDTSPEAEQVLSDIYRKMPFARKWLLMGEIFQTAKTLHAAGVRTGAALSRIKEQPDCAAVLGWFPPAVRDV